MRDTTASLVAAAHSVGTGQSDDLLVIEALTVEHVPQVLGALSSVRKAAIGRARRFILSISASESEWNLWAEVVRCFLSCFVRLDDTAGKSAKRMRLEKRQNEPQKTQSAARDYINNARTLRILQRQQHQRMSRCRQWRPRVLFGANTVPLDFSI